MSGVWQQLNGTQIVSNGGNGTVATMRGGTQIVGYVDSSGTVYPGGTGTVETMSNGLQYVYSTSTAAAPARSTK